MVLFFLLEKFQFWFSSDLAPQLVPKIKSNSSLLLSERPSCIGSPHFDECSRKCYLLWNMHSFLGPTWTISYCKLRVWSYHQHPTPHFVSIENNQKKRIFQPFFHYEPPFVAIENIVKKTTGESPSNFPWRINNPKENFEPLFVAFNERGSNLNGHSCVLLLSNFATRHVPTKRFSNPPTGPTNQQVDDLYYVKSMVRILQVDYYKTCKTFYSKKKREWGEGEGGGGQNKRKKKNGKEGQCLLTSPLYFYFWNLNNPKVIK